MQHVYALFGFEFHLELSTRPDNFLGAIETWDVAEEVRIFFLSWHRSIGADIDVFDLY